MRCFFIVFYLFVFTIQLQASDLPEKKKDILLKEKGISGSEYFLSLTTENKEKKQKFFPEKEKQKKLKDSTEVSKDSDVQIDRGKFPSKDSGTKAAADFPYLHGFNLTLASYSYSEDESRYGEDIRKNRFIPQGLTQDEDGNLLISMYHGYSCFFSSTPCSSKRSIIVHYQPSTAIILNVFTLNDIPVGSHVGGIGYYHKYTGTINPKEWLFVSYGRNIRVYKVYYRYIGNSRVKKDISYLTSYSVEHATSTISTSHGYLWTAGYDEIENDSVDSRWITGYKMVYNPNFYQVQLIKKYRVKQPKFYIQGVYCDSDPEVEKRLKFYFVASDNISYVYQAILATKDIDNSGIIDRTNEYYWESFFTPYGYNEGTGRKLPDGGEGIIMKDGRLWMLNEGATKYYCDKWGGGDDVDCAREILVINPVYFYDDHAYTVFPAGSIEITGSGLEDAGFKVALVLSQNKQGKFYYSIGEFTCEYRKCKMYLKEPSTRNPVGKQANHNYYYNDWATAYVEDIIGIQFMNLEDRGYVDDFTLETLKISFDDDYYLKGGSNFYAITRNLNGHFGNEPTDRNAMEYYFQFKHNMGNGTVGSDGPGWDQGLMYYSLDDDNAAYNALNNCYAHGGHKPYCRNKGLDKMEEYVENHEWWFFYYRINYSISRFYDIEQ